MSVIYLCCPASLRRHDNPQPSSEGLVPGAEWFKRITPAARSTRTSIVFFGPGPAVGLQSETTSQEVAAYRTVNYRIEAAVGISIVKPQSRGATSMSRLQLRARTT